MCSHCPDDMALPTAETIMPLNELPFAPDSDSLNIRNWCRSLNEHFYTLTMDKHELILIFPAIVQAARWDIN